MTLSDQVISKRQEFLAWLPEIPDASLRSDSKKRHHQGSISEARCVKVKKHLDELEQEVRG